MLVWSQSCSKLCWWNFDPAKSGPKRIGKREQEGVKEREKGEEGTRSDPLFPADK